jgi:hypothetical protein
VQRVPFLAAATLFTLVVLLYIPTLRGGFVYDSIAQVLYSDYIHTPSHRVDVLTLRVVAEDELDRNRPMHLASLMPADAAVWGRNPFGYRATYFCRGRDKSWEMGEHAVHWGQRRRGVGLGETGSGGRCVRC